MTKNGEDVINTSAEIWQSVTCYTGDPTSYIRKLPNKFAAEYSFSIGLVLFNIILFPATMLFNCIPAKKKKKKFTQHLKSKKMIKFLLAIIIISLPITAQAAPSLQSAEFDYHLSQLENPTNPVGNIYDNISSDSESSTVSADLSSSSSTSEEGESSLRETEIFPGINIPCPGKLDENDFRILSLNTDGCKDWDGILKQTKLRKIHAMCLVDAERPHNHGATKHLIKQKFSHDSTVSINAGISQLFRASSLGGTVTAVGRGWAQRCSGFIPDKFGWGRYSVLKINGTAARSIWVLSLYAPYGNKESPESYYNLLLYRMKDYESRTSKRLARDKNGNMCPTLQLRDEMGEILREARRHGAEMVFTGDFNEKWVDHGTLRQWAEDNCLCNVLDPDEITGGATTCFPSSGPPSDIDWVLCTPALQNNGLIKAGVLHSKIAATAHCPIFITIRAMEWLKISKADIPRYSRLQYPQNHITGKPDDIKIHTFQKLLCSNWGKFNVPKLKSKAEFLVDKLESALECHAPDQLEIENLTQHVDSNLKIVYSAIVKAFQKSLNQMSYRYATGKNRLTYYSQKMVEIRRMRSRAWRLSAMWAKFSSQPGNPFLNNSPRGKHRGGHRNARGTNPKINELKHRLIRWFERTGKISPELTAIFDSISTHLVQLPVNSPSKRNRKKWQKINDAMGDMIKILDHYLSIKYRKDMVNEVQDKAIKNKTRGIKQIIRNLSIPKAKAGAISRIEDEGELVSNPEEISARLVAFWDVWFGKGRQHRWNVNADGSSAHALCDRTQRAKILIQALMDGNYSQVANESERLPESVQKLYDLGLFSPKIITKGPLAGSKISPEQMSTLRSPPTTTEWRNARTKLTKCTHPGKDKITKPSLRHCPYHLYMELGKIIFMAETHNVIFEQHKQVQMWLIPKDDGNQKIDRLRPLWFESELLKLQEHIMESRVDNLCKKFGILEKEQSGFEKGKECGSAIFPVSQLIEDSRIANRELWIAFLDQAKAFDTLESFQGKLMASLVLGLPFEYANKKVKFDESVIAEIITAYGTSWEILGFKKGTFVPQCGGLQGGPRSPGMWKRFYDILIRAQKLVKDGKLAYIVSEDGEKITLTSKVYADDTVLLSGDNQNLQARAKMQQLLVDYSGSNVKPVKCIITAIIHELDGKNLRHIEAQENIGFTDLNDLTYQNCKPIGPTDPFRYLGWFSCVSIAMDQSFIQMMVGCKEEVNYIYTCRCTGRELTTFVNAKSLPRVLYRMRYSTTGEESISRLQLLYNDLFRTKAKIIGGFPKNLMYAIKETFGLGYVNFWDAISIDRVVTYLKHSFSDCQEPELFAAAVMRSEKLQQSSTPFLQRKFQHPWDGTMLGRIKEWFTSNNFTIAGGKRNFGHRENDVAILDLVVEKRDLEMIIAGCQTSGIFWKSQTTVDDGNTWIPELQWNGKFIKKGMKFVWYAFRTEYKSGERVHTRKETLWTSWSNKIKSLLKINHCSAANLGRYFQDTLACFKPMDVILTSDSSLPKLVVKQEGEIVHYLQCDIPRQLKINISSCASQDTLGFQWERNELGLKRESYFANSGKLYTTPWGAIKQIARIKAIKVSAQFAPIKTGPKNFRQADLADALNGQGSFGKLGGVFFRYACTSSSRYRVLWYNVKLNLPQYRLPDYMSGYASVEQFVGEGNAGHKGLPLSKLFSQWRVKVAPHKKWGIIAGGDGSAKMLPAGQEAAFAWCVMAIGPLSIQYLSKQSAKYVKILASGGSADWTIRKYRTNTRAEKMHVLAAMIALLASDMNVWYFVDYSGAISVAIDVQTWIASDWVQCEDRDILSAILFMQQLWESKGYTFKLVKIRAHPEKWCSLHVNNYKALHQMAVLQDTAAKNVFSRCHGTGVRPFLPGQFRFQLTHNGEEVVGPIRKYLKDSIGNSYIQKHISNKKHNGNFHRVSKLTERRSIKSWANKCWTGFTPMANCKYLFQRWATLTFQVKTGILEQNESDLADVDLCSCGEPETMWHILSEGKCSGFQTVRRKHSERRIQMLQDLGVKNAAIQSITINAEIKSDGTYPDWNANDFEWEHQLCEATSKWLQKGEGLWSRWFQRGPLPCGFIENSGAVLGLIGKDAEKFGKKWLDSKCNEASELWRLRNHLRHNSNEASLVLMGELRAKLKSLVLHRRKAGLVTRKNSYYHKQLSSSLKRLISQYEAEVALEAASQPTIMLALQQVGLDENAANLFAANSTERYAIAAARKQSLQRRKSAEKQHVAVRTIDSIFDSEESEEILINVSDNSLDASIIVQQFMRGATVEYLDAEAVQNISREVEYMLSNEKDDWEL